MPAPNNRAGGAPLDNRTASASQNAALLGAAVAFGRQPPKQRQVSNGHVATVGGLAAASGSGRMSKTPSPKRGFTASSGAADASPISPVGNIQNGGYTAQSANLGLRSGNTPFLSPPQLYQEGRSKSPSQRAAQLATARSPQPSQGATDMQSGTKAAPKPAVAPKPRRLSLSRSLASNDGAVDSEPIPSTSSIVDFFERTASPRQTSDARPEPLVMRNTRDLPLQSPKPIRTSDGGITSIFQMELDRRKGASTSPTSKGPAGNESSEQYDVHSLSDAYVSASEDNAASGPPLPVAKRVIRAPSVGPGPSPIARNRLPGPSPSPLRRPSTESQLGRSIGSPPELFSTSSQSSKSIAAQWHQIHHRRVTPLHTGDALANAIVASSLASSRAPSPHKVEPPPVPMTRRKHHHKLGFSRTPSPPKHTMRHTMRKVESEEYETDDEVHPYGKHKKKRLVRKHPNKHHEGDRKRWRDAISERERKRYEGVWAANKGLCNSFTVEEEQKFQHTPEADWVVSIQEAAAEQVSNIIVRDIWNRSRLPEAALETVWDLVDNDGVGRLTKDEFVVGMWLVDQRLKGRKLPVKVTESVWASVRELQGIKIRKK